MTGRRTTTASTSTSSRYAPLLITFLASWPALVAGAVTPVRHAIPRRRFITNVAPRGSDGYASPLGGTGGSMLTFVPGTFPAGQGEPLNIIISGSSDSRVLVDSINDGGLQNFFLSFNFTTECLGQHLGDHQAANLGDGNGTKNETAVIRFDYGNPYTGTCTETVDGGGHFRYWTQNGPDANTGAVFMAASYEQSVKAGHDIVPNGYDFGRDWVVGNITGQSTPIPTLDFALPTPAYTNFTTNTTVPATSGFLPTYTGTSTYGNYTYRTTATYVPGLLTNTSVGINHNDTVPLPGRSAIDGLVAVLEVKIIKTPTGSAMLNSLIPTPSLFVALALVFGALSL